MDFLKNLVLKQVRRYIKKFLQDRLVDGETFVVGADWLPDLSFQGWNLDLGLAVTPHKRVEEARHRKAGPLDRIDITDLDVDDEE